MLSFLLGLLLKLYDEISDGMISVSLLNVEIIKYFIIGFATILSIHNSNFLVLLTVCMLASLVSDTNLFNIVKCETKNVAFNDNFWYASLAYFIFLTIYLSKNISFQCIFYCVPSFLFTLFESQFFPNENDTKKIIFRVISVITLIIIILFRDTLVNIKLFNIPIFHCLNLEYLIILGYSCLGYASLSVLLLIKDRIKEIKQPEPKEPEPKNSKNKSTENLSSKYLN